MAATYYSLQNKLRTSISLNNKGIVPLEVRPTLFNLAGERLDVPPVTINPTSFRVFDLAEWAAPGGSGFEQGSLQLFYRGKDLLLGAQIKMIDSDSSLIFDEQLTEPNNMRSSRLDGLWSIPSLNSQVRIVISNTSDLRQAAQVRLDGVQPKQEGLKELILEPHQTLVIDPALDVIDKRAILMKASGMTITHSGKPGALIARAMIENPSTGYSASVPFTDPNKSRSSKLHGTGLRIEAVEGEELIPVIVARNIGEKAATLHGRISYTRKDGSRGVMPIRSASLNAGEVKTWEIAEVAALRKAEIKSAGLEFDYNTQPGSVMVSAFTVGSKGNQVFQVPILDPSAQTSSTGVYPFYLDYGSSTMVYIKNTTDQEQRYITHLNYEGGAYMIGAKSIAAGETVAIDIRSLRNNQVPDTKGRVIPLDIERGQFRWTIIQQEGKELLAMIGRAEQVYEGRAMSSTYACQSCCGDFALDSSVSPILVEMQVGQSIQLEVVEERSDCNGFLYSLEQPASWNSSNGTVASVSDGRVTPLKAGQTTIRASWASSSSVSTYCEAGPGFGPGPGPIGPVPCCGSNTVPRSASAIIRVIPRVIISGAQTVMDGDTASFSIQSPDATPTSINWSFNAPTGAGNNPNVRFTPNGSANTVTNAHWFAFPNIECPRTNCNSTYNILCTVQFSIGFNVTVTQSTTLTVNGCWNPAGVVANPLILGGPTFGFHTGRNLWIVVNSGSLTRQPQSKIISVPFTSQFFFKTVEHEKVHEQQYATGMLSDLWTVNSLMTDLLPLTDTTEAGLRAKINSTAITWANKQRDIFRSRASAAEREAYSVSDLIAPRYIYQNCGQFQ
jgi:hypothetical protein